MHKIPLGKTTETWRQFVDDLFAKQDGFVDQQKTSVQSIRTQYDSRIEKFKQFHGFEDGKCKNLSGQEGDLADPDKTIKMILEEQAAFLQDRKTVEAAKIAADKTEQTVLINAQKSNSRRKKLDGSVVATTSKSFRSTEIDDLSNPSQPLQSSKPLISHTYAVQEFQRSLDSFTSSLNSPSPAKKKLKKPLESDVESELYNIIQDKDTCSILTACGIKYSEEVRELFDEAVVAVILNTYCAPSKKIDYDFITNRFCKYGFNVLQYSKLYNYLHSEMIKIIEKRIN